MKALCLVAHPDDCVIFGWGFIKKYKFDWTIAYLTHGDDDPRSLEMAKFWNDKGIKTIHAGYNDDWNFVERGELGFNEKDATRFCKLIPDSYNLLLTHNHFGEYGHIHHKFIHNCVKDLLTPKVYFGNFPEYYTDIIQIEPYNVHELPLHKDVLLGFDNSRFKYYITDGSRWVLNGRTS